MSATLSLEVSDEFIERICVDLAVVTFFDTDRPLRGDAGRADWRLCGRISRLLLAGKLGGAAGEALLIPADSGLAARWLLALGLGPRDGFDAESCAAFGRDAVARAARLRVSTLALGLPDPRSGDLAASTLLEALLAGAIAALAEKSHDIRMCIISPAGEMARTRKALAALIPRLRPATVALQMDDLPTLGRARPSPPGADGSSLQSRQGIK